MNTICYNGKSLLVFLSSLQDSGDNPYSRLSNAYSSVSPLEGTASDELIGSSSYLSPPPNPLHNILPPPGGIPSQLVADYDYPPLLPNPQFSQTAHQGGGSHHHMGDNCFHPPPPFIQGSSQDNHLGGDSMMYVTWCLLNYIDQGINTSSRPTTQSINSNYHRGIGWTTILIP